MTPLSAEKHILDKFYGRNKRFTNAVNNMKKVQQNIVKEKEHKRTEQMSINKTTQKDEQQQLIERVQRRTIKIVLNRLKPKEIEKWAPKPPQSHSMVLRKR